ncbi:MAG: SDR family oxidoreductase, partial [Solirubrobacterales bacterium]|nr:SDR family oxidoreductase [Solirubrobacterales bacterium]
MILVIGGRSKIGSALIPELLERGEEVRALVRSSESANWFPAGVSTVSGDLADPGSLVVAMNRADRVFLLCGPSKDEFWLNRNAIDAAESADVRLLVRSSILGADPDSSSTFHRDHGMADEYLRDSLVDHTILRPNLFLQNIPDSTLPSIDPQGNFYVNAADARISMVDTRDVAAVATVALTEPGHENQECDVTGPEALSYSDVASVIGELEGRTVTYVDALDDGVRSAMLEAGLDDWFASALVELYQDYRRSGVDGYAARVTDTVRRITGRSARTLRGLLEEARPPTKPA